MCHTDHLYLPGKLRPTDFIVVWFGVLAVPLATPKKTWFLLVIKKESILSRSLLYQ